MSHNHLPPSPFGAGTQYDGARKHIVSPETHDKLPVNLPRIARVIGEKAAEASVQTPPRIWRGEAAEVPPQVVTYVSISDMQPSGSSYAGAASRQIDLERAEVENIQRAAADAGMSVDQWKAARRRR